MILLIGASGGIGKELLPHLAKRDQVIATYHSSPLRALPKGVRQIKLDLSSSKEVLKFAHHLRQRANKIIFINLAALSVDDLFLNLSLSSWKKVFDVNLHSSALMLQTLLPKMIENRWGRIILASSVVAEQGVVGAGAYCSSKLALEGLCKTLAHEYGRFNITSNLLKMGYFEKGLIETLAPASLQEVLDRIPSKKFGSVKNIFHAIDFMLKADYLNGASITLDGGLVR